MPHPLFVQFLIFLRARLLRLAPHMGWASTLERRLRKQFYHWFHVGSLSLVQIEWENTPPSVLKKLMAYEAVHPIHSLDELKRRLDTDRRIFAFFHSHMPLEPLIFVQVAFTKGMGSNIQAILDMQRTPLALRESDTATFYSISNAQEGLRGINFGHSLIKRAVCTISRGYPHITTFTTLSPIPGFRQWLEALCHHESILMTEDERHLISSLTNGAWKDDPDTCNRSRPILMRLCAHYLVNERCSGRPIDPVVNFHLSNGAMIEQLHWLADISDKGMQQSYGIMVNYHYQLEQMEQHSQAFTQGGKIVASESIRRYL